jgi:hypothetical protein
MDDCDEGKRIGSSWYHYCRFLCLTALCVEASRLGKEYNLRNSALLIFLYFLVELSTLGPSTGISQIMHKKFLLTPFLYKIWI